MTQRPLRTAEANTRAVERARTEFTPTPERQIRETVREFADEEIRPQLAKSSDSGVRFEVSGVDAV